MCLTFKVCTQLKLTTTVLDTYGARILAKIIHISHGLDYTL